LGAALWIGVFGAATAFGQSSANTVPWQMDRGDARASASSDGVGPSSPSLQWSVMLDAPGEEIAIDREGTAYVPAHPGVVAVGGNGRKRWQTPLPDRPELALSGDGRRLFVTYSSLRGDEPGSYLACLETGDGRPLWSHRVSPTTGISAPVPAADGTIYVTVEGKLQSFEPSEGKPVRSVAPERGASKGRPLIDAANGQVLAPGERHLDAGTTWLHLAAFDLKSGARRWMQEPVGARYALDPGGNLYTGAWWPSGVVYGGFLRCYDPRGSQRWSVDVYVATPLAVGKEGVSFGQHAAARNVVSQWGENGRPRYEVGPMLERPTIDAAGKLYGWRAGKLVGLDASGREMWRMALPGMRFGSTGGTIALDGRGDLVFVAGDALFSLVEAAVATATPSPSPTPTFSPTPTPWVTPEPQPSLTVVYPEAGGQLIKGEQSGIAWEWSDYNGNVRVVLYKGGRPAVTLSNAVAVSRGYDGIPFTPSTDWPDGTDYQIGVAATNGSVSALSQTFSIVSGAGDGGFQEAPGGEEF
jgi:hypothetical protein